MKHNKVKKLVYIAFTGAMVLLLAKLTRFPPFPQAAYLKLEFGEVPLLLLLMLGGCGMAMEALLVKELLSFLLYGTNLFGITADFVACAVFLLVFSLVWKNGGGAKRIIAATAVGILARMLIAIPVNLIILPLQYGTPIAGVWAQMVYILPFNALKSLLDGVCILFLYPRLRPVLQKNFIGLAPKSASNTGSRDDTV